MKILLVDDDHESRESLERFLKHLGHDTHPCESGDKAWNVLKQQNFDLVLTDIKMPTISGVDLLKKIKKGNLETHVVLFTGFGTMETAIQAVRLGALDYLLKPVGAEDLARVLQKISHKIEKVLPNRNSILPKDQIPRNSWQFAEQASMIAVSSTMKEIFDLALKFHEDREIIVLLEGETGTGKEVVARLIHEGLESSNTPFIDLNCAAISSTLFESELFGYEGGAFTGGHIRGQKGKFDLASKGTLFLDEIGEIPLDIQTKLLRVLEERTYYRVGGGEKIRTDARIIAATNANLDEAVARGSFRKDLFYRLQVGRIKIPPLRERVEDIVPLALSFMREFSKKRNKNFRSINREAQKILLQYSWPGNIREMKNLFDFITFSNNEYEITPKHLKAISSIAIEEDLEKLDNTRLKLFTADFVKKALIAHNGNKTETAEYLGISRRSLYRLFERLGIEF
jgi:two-component system, NtrC family, response regulator AtoC